MLIIIFVSLDKVTARLCCAYVFPMVQCDSANLRTVCQHKQIKMMCKCVRVPAKNGNVKTAAYTCVKKNSTASNKKRANSAKCHWFLNFHMTKK